MPLNKSFQRRIEILDACLRRRQRHWTIDALHAEVSRRLEEQFGMRVSRRSIYDDLRYLQYELDAPIEKYRMERRICFRYADPQFSTRNLPLRPDDLDLLRDAVEILGQVHGFPAFRELPEVLHRLEHTIATRADNTGALIQFEQNLQALGTQWLEPLFEAVRGKTVLQITYQPFGKQSVLHDFHPYLLREYRQRWFLIGRIDGRRQVTNLALDRIIRFRPLLKTFMENDLFDPDNYFDHLIGVSWPDGEQPLTVILKLEAALWPYVKTKPIHESQELVKTFRDGGARIQLQVVNNYELRMTLLGLGPGLVVESPDTVRQQIRILYQQGFNTYSGAVPTVVPNR